MWNLCAFLCGTLWAISQTDALGLDLPSRTLEKINPSKGTLVRPKIKNHLKQNQGLPPSPPPGVGHGVGDGASQDGEVGQRDGVLRLEALPGG